MLAQIFNHGKFPEKSSSLDVELYEKICNQSRDKELYTRFQVPDSPQGRFEMLALHLFMVLYVLKQNKEPKAALISQKLVDYFVVDMDQSFRTLHISDKKMAKSFKYALEGFYGRLYSYDQGMASSPEDLQDRLQKNIYQNLVINEAEVLYLLSDYIYHQIDRLKQTPMADMGFVQVEGHVDGTRRI
jgi:cytochrome b pre-mRNA-processing protein 3